jgi:5-methylcytosine-specific restriction endonuclease McrBC GTP-binding regulatory subunit McrB
MKNLLKNFNETAVEASLVLDSNVLHRFVASLLAKRFLILTGLSGSGKTKLAQAFAQYLSRSGSATVRLIPVGSDWTSNENVVGYPDGLNPANYLVQPALESILYALEKPTEPFFLILDEMNLSHVERYFADSFPLLNRQKRSRYTRELNVKVPGEQFRTRLRYQTICLLSVRLTLMRRPICSPQRFWIVQALSNFASGQRTSGMS